MSSAEDEVIRSRISRLSANSRYRLTRLYKDKARGKSVLRWGIWNRPKIEMSQYYNYLVQVGDVGRLDRVSRKFYGDDSLWWAIADVNNIKNIFTDMVPGSVIKVPVLSSIERALNDENRKLYG